MHYTSGVSQGLRWSNNVDYSFNDVHNISTYKRESLLDSILLLRRIEIFKGQLRDIQDSLRNAFTFFSSIARY